jgi:hypothetical protein
MAIDAKDLMIVPHFEAYGTFNSVVDFTPDGGERYLAFRFDYLGGQFSVQVDEGELEKVPEEGTPYRIVGKVRYNNRNGSISLVPEQKTLLKEMSGDDFAKGLRIIGAGIVEDKKVTTMNRQTYKKVTLKWCGGLHLFKDMPDELYAKVPPRGKYVKFQFGVSTHTERGEGGKQIQLQVPVLLGVQGEELRSVLPSDTPSAGAASVPPQPRRASA